MHAQQTYTIIFYDPSRDNQVEAVFEGCDTASTRWTDQGCVKLRLEQSSVKDGSGNHIGWDYSADDLTIIGPIQQWRRDSCLIFDSDGHRADCIYRENDQKPPGPQITPESALLDTLHKKLAATNDLSMEEINQMLALERELA